MRNEHSSPQVLVSSEAFRVYGFESCYEAYPLLSGPVKSLIAQDNRSTRRAARSRRSQRYSSVCHCRLISSSGVSPPRGGSPSGERQPPLSSPFSPTAPSPSLELPTAATYSV